MTQEILLRGGRPGGGGVIAERSFCQDSEGWWRWVGWGGCCESAAAKSGN